MRHDRVGAHLHNSKYKALGVETKETLYARAPKLVCENADVTVLWNQGYTQIIIISNLSNDRSKATSKTIPPHSAI